MSTALRRLSKLTLSRRNRIAAELWGKPGHLTEDQSAALSEFRTRTKDLSNRVNRSWRESRSGTTYISDVHLLRFLRSRRFDLEKARMQLVESIEFQEKQARRKVTEDSVKGLLLMHEQGLVYRAGFDRENRPVVVCTLAQYFPSKLTSIDELVDFFTVYVNQLCALAEKNGGIEFTCIVDMKHFSSSNFKRKHVKALFKMLQDDYPERLGKCFIVHSPKSVQGVYNIVKPFLHKRTIGKVKVIGETYAPLQDVIDEDVIEEKFGGTHGPYPIPDEITAAIVS